MPKAVLILETDENAFGGLTQLEWESRAPNRQQDSRQIRDRPGDVLREVAHFLFNKSGRLFCPVDHGIQPH
jgi:hypothetical protein